MSKVVVPNIIPCMSYKISDFELEELWNNYKEDIINIFFFCLF